MATSGRGGWARGQKNGASIPRVSGAYEKGDGPSGAPVSGHTQPTQQNGIEHRIIVVGQLGLEGQ